MNFFNDLWRPLAGALFGVLVLSACSEDTTSELLPQNPDIEVWNGTSGMDTRFSPGTNFYLYTNGGWLEQHPIPDGEERTGVMIAYRAEQERKLTQLLQTSTDPTVATLTRLSQDLIRNGDYALEAIKPLLEEISAIQTPEELLQVTAHLIREGYTPFIQWAPRPGQMNERVFFPMLNVSKPPFPAKYYSDESFFNEYLLCMQHTLEELELKEGEEASQVASNALQTERFLAERANENSYDALYFNSPEALARLQPLNRTRSGGYLSEWLAQCGFHTTVYTLVPGVLDVLGTLVEDPDVEQFKDYLYVHVLRQDMYFLSPEMISSWCELEKKAEVEHYKDYESGYNDGWLKEAYRHLKEYAPALLSRLYAQAYATPGGKDRLERMAEHLRSVFRKRIEQNTWLNAGTKARALEKLDGMTFCINYPDQWPEQPELNLSTRSYSDALADLRRFAYASKMRLLGQPIAGREWDYFLIDAPLYTYNCFYTWTMNSLVIETTFSIPPFVEEDTPDYQLYGTLGAVVGHEMTHGFDSQGAKYDKTGALASWWEQADQEAFQRKQQQMIQWYDHFEIQPGLFGDGTRTLTENIADLGGTTIACEAFLEKLQDAHLTEEASVAARQNFFLSYARLWCGEETLEFTQKRFAKNDSHSLDKFRVLGVVPMIETWYKAFSIGSGDAMYRSPEERIVIW